MLYIVSTPIGNLGDITFRALDTLKKVDYILCEDTRRTKKLLFHFEFGTPLKSFNAFSETRKTEQVIQDLKNGNEIALVSDSGTPLINDPGYFLVKECIKNDITVIPIPGVNAAITALSVSGFNTENFHYKGFLPKKQGRLTKAIEEIKDNEGTIIFYESPHRILKSLKIMNEIIPNHNIVIARELTKKFETVYRGSLEDVLEQVKPKGEFVVIIEKVKK